MHWDDETIRARLVPADAVRWMGEAIDEHHRGALVSPARASADLGDGRLVFTCARRPGDWFGYRSYDTLGGEPGAQVVVVQDEVTGAVRAIAVGNQLGPCRTGAIGAVAIDAMAAPEAPVVAVIGTGTQAATQLWALGAVRAPQEVRVFSRGAARRGAFAARQTTLTGLPCRAVDTAREAVDGAHVVILATSSREPVIDAAWLRPGAHVTTLGPKQRGRAEFDLGLAEAAGTIATDSLAQLGAYDPPSLLAGTAHAERCASLGALRAAGHRHVPGSLSLFCSVGLAGTEPFLLDRLGLSARW